MAAEEVKQKKTIHSIVIDKQKGDDSHGEVQGGSNIQHDMLKGGS